MRRGCFIAGSSRGAAHVRWVYLPSACDDVIQHYPSCPKEHIYILIEQVQLPRSGPATPRNFREATGLPPISIFLPLQIYYSL